MSDKRDVAQFTDCTKGVTSPANSARARPRTSVLGDTMIQKGRTVWHSKGVVQCDGLEIRRNYSSFGVVCARVSFHTDDNLITQGAPFLRAGVGTCVGFGKVRRCRVRSLSWAFKSAPKLVGTSHAQLFELNLAPSLWMYGTIPS